MTEQNDDSLVLSQPAGDSLPDTYDITEEEARRALMQFAVADPAVRKRVFSTLLRAIAAAGGA
jgi:hypothetical protein